MSFNSLSRFTLLSLSTLAILFGSSSFAQAITVAPNVDIMASPFFQGTDRLRGYAGDNRNTHRVSSADPFGLTGSETLYIGFDAFDFSTVTGPFTAILSLQSVSGGFGADADAANPFLVSAHGVSANPFSSITDDTYPTGPTDWLTFAATEIIAAPPSAQTLVGGFGTVEFDVTALVNDWILGTNTVEAIALTGFNQAAGSDFLHGFLNETENAGSTFLEITVVPEPSTALLMLLGLSALSAAGRRGDAIQDGPQAAQLDGSSRR